MAIKARADDTGGSLGLVEATFYRGFGPPLHVHSREDEGFYVLEGEIRFRQGDHEFLAGPGSWVWGPRGVAHAFKVESNQRAHWWWWRPAVSSGCSKRAECR